LKNLPIISTADGSHTLFDAMAGEHYHSVNGAIAESLHVYIGAGLLERLKSAENINILEIGFGTGLNALLTWYETIGKAMVKYHAIDIRPIELQLALKLAYGEKLPHHAASQVFRDMLQTPWNREVQVDTHFYLKKEQADVLLFEAVSQTYDLVYFDAFSPAAQPDLWTAEVFEKIFKGMKPGGILTTYAAKGIVKQAMRKAGFLLERLPGSRGKRHMLRARNPYL
jgi:tRNA U34 5-methylaminomethyl-2-thiouridine-forming methyltransferase MnmC